MRMTIDSLEAEGTALREELDRLYLQIEIIEAVDELATVDGSLGWK